MVYKNHQKYVINYTKNNIRQHRHRMKRKAEVSKLLGTICFICDNSKRKIHYHEIHGKTHIYDYCYILNHLDDFSPICCRCHNVLHYLYNLGKKLKKMNKSLNQLNGGEK